MKDKKQTTKITISMAEVKENEDFYIENGYFVFTEAFLLKRGYCCENGCRHCPYEAEKKGK